MSNTLDENKYLKLNEVKDLMEFCSRSWDKANGSILPARDAFLAELGLSTGLRVHEMAALQCRDLQVLNGRRSVVVRKGKGGKRRVVRISEAFSNQCRRFLNQKQRLEEPIGPESPVFYSKRTERSLTRRTLQRSFKRVLKGAKLPDFYSIHALRHVYGTLLCRASGYNLRLVQNQMGHSSIRSTEIYLHVESDVLDSAVERYSQLIQVNPS